MQRFFLSICAAVVVFGGWAQQAERDTIAVSAELRQTLSSGSHTPFWLAANRQGLSSIDKGYGYFDIGAVKKMDYDRRFSWGAGVELAVPWKFTSNFVIQQLYGEIRYRSLSLMVGSHNRESYLVDRELSGGELLFSGNARPIPQVRAGIMHFEPLRFTNNWLSIKGHVAYGKFTDSSWQEHWAAPMSRYNKGVLMCDRGLWLKAGNEEKFPLTFSVGIEMATQFEGTIYNYERNGVYRDIKAPTGFSAWMKAFVPLPGSSDNLESESTNVEGNTVGAYDFNLGWTSDAGLKVNAYWQHMFEDHSMMWIQFPWLDGLWGLNVSLPKNPIISGLTYELMCSKYQSGPVYNDTSAEVPEQVSGVDNYYNNELYTGWMHWGMAIGNPFFVSPIYNSDHILEFYANRNISHHVGIKGDPMEGLHWRLLLSNTRSWGNYYKPFPEVRDMWNFLAEVKWRPEKLKQLECQLSVAFDRGDLVGNNFGVLLGVKYDLPLSVKKLR